MCATALGKSQENCERAKQSTLMRVIHTFYHEDTKTRRETFEKDLRAFMPLRQNEQIILSRYLLNAFDLRADRGEFLFDFEKTAIDLVGVVDAGFTAGTKGGSQNRDTGPDVGTGQACAV